MKKLSLFFIILILSTQGVEAKTKKTTPVAPTGTTQPKTLETSLEDEAQEQMSYGSQRISRSQVGMELLGSAILYSINGSYLVTDQFAVNVGLSYFTLSSSSTGLTYSESVGVTQIPISGSYLFGGPDHHFELLAGGDLIMASATISGKGTADRVTGSGFIPEFGAGYRYWPAAGGFHFKGMLYALAIPNHFTIWPGFSFGYAF